MRPALSDYRHLTSGKVRELYRIDDEHLLFVATDRISAYDYILDSEIPDKGRILTAMSVFFFDYVEAPNHLAGPPDDERVPDEVLGRALVVRELEMVPVECVARGYLTGSGLLDYQRTGKVSGIVLPPGLTEASKFVQPLFTPATKAELAGLGQAGRQHDTADLAGPLVVQQSRAGQVAAGHALHRDHLQFAHHQRAAQHLVGDPRVVGRAGQVVGRLDVIEEEHAHRGQDAALVRDLVVQDVVVCGDAIGGDEQQVLVVDGVQLANLAAG